ncbi:MAG: hypothetical protein ACOYMR_10050 [Ilumatobacteraceae bacterium]
MIVTVTSWRGVGATTTALLLAAAIADEQPAWLVEADPAGGVLAGRIHLDGAALGGLERVGFPPDDRTGADAFAAYAHHHGALRVVAAPADPFRAHACHTPRMPWVPSLADLDGIVVVDAGRMRGGSPSWPLLAIADLLVVVTSPEVCAAVATAEWVDAMGRVSSAEPELDDASLAVVAVDQPGGVSFAPHALAEEFGDRWGGWLPWEPITVDLVQRGAVADDRRLRRSSLMSAIRAMADRLFHLEVV